MKIVICDPQEIMEMDFSVLYKHLPSDSEVIKYVYKNDKNELINILKDAEAIITSYVPIDREVMQKCTKLKIISVWATGYDNIDCEAASDLDIVVCSVKEYCTQEVAEHTMLLILSLVRKIFVYAESVQKKFIWNYDIGVEVLRLEGLTLGILGLGKIGRAVAKRAGAFGMKIIAYDPYVSVDDAEKLGINLVSMEEIFKEANVITLHMNLTSENKNFFDFDKFTQMKKRPYIINVARGGVINEKDLVKALNENLIRGAALDVLSSESPDLMNCPLLGREDVILTPHMGFYSIDSIAEAQRIGAESIDRFFRGTLQNYEPANIATKQAN